jgi:hypothetical protein
MGNEVEASPERIRNHLRRPDADEGQLIMKPPLTPLVGQVRARGERSAGVAVSEAAAAVHLERRCLVVQVVDADREAGASPLAMFDQRGGVAFHQNISGVVQRDIKTDCIVDDRPACLAFFVEDGADTGVADRMHRGCTVFDFEGAARHRWNSRESVVLDGHHSAAFGVDVVFARSAANAIAFD